MSTSSKPTKPTLADLTTLCLACSCSLPPIRTQNNDDIYRTSCCRQPICPTCVAANPRLTRYNPCLSCLNGVTAVAHTSRETRNMDGGVNDEDLFTVGSDDEDDDSGQEEESTTTPVPAEDIQQLPTSNTATAVPNRYYIKKDDSLRALALHFRVSGLELCRLNTLPASTLTTTPHILHTRQYLLMPASVASSSLLPPPHPDTDEGEKGQRQVRRARERAEKRLQTLTKEVDWRVAKAYVAIAESESSDLSELNRKRKEMDLTAVGDGLEALAVDSYWDDDQWEAEQKRAGKGVFIPRVPSAGPSSTSKEPKRGWFS